MKRVVLGVILLIFAGCTPYQKNKDFSLLTPKGGYSDFQIAENKFSVSFQSNSHTSSDRTYRYALKRAAELTLIHQYKYFAIENERNLTKQIVKRNTKSGSSSVTYEPGVTLHITCYEERPASTDVFDAQELLKVI